MSQPNIRVLLVDDEEIIHQTIGDYLRDCGHLVEQAREGVAALKLMAENEYDLSLVDLRMPGMDGMALMHKAQKLQPLMSVVLITGHGTMETVIEALRLGAADFLPKPIKLRELDAVLEKCKQLRELRRERRHLQETIRGLQSSRALGDGTRGFIGVSTASQRIRDQVKQAVDAQCDTILILGETGTGKEVVAREIHELAGSEESPFIAVSCPALPESLIVSELFGHVKGTFTGAAESRAGYFELADEGTLFLDEVADLSQAAQAALLRVLETRTLRRVGGADEVNVQVRVIAASNVKLEELIERGTFRRDLYYRLNIYTIELPPLRCRPEDIMPLAEHFLAAYATARGFDFTGFDKAAQALLRSYEYPGNARELRNLVERAAILCRSGTVTMEHLYLPESTNAMRQTPVARLPKDAERDRIVEALETAKWNRRKAAAELGMPYSTLRYKLRSLGIE